jgi:F5/8 type C domain
MFDVNLAREDNLVLKRILEMSNKNFALGLATLALSIANAPNAQAALINGVTVSTDMGNASGNINNIVNGAGLPGNIPSLTGTHAAGSVSNAWLGSLIAGNITFNLNGTYSLAGFSLWNYNAASAFGVKDVNVLTSTDGGTFTSVAGSPTQFAVGATFAPEAPEQFSFAPVTASYVRFQVLSNYGSFLTGLSEVQFNSASATSVPEPFTILGTLTGLGGGAALKRRLKAFKSKSV